ncbi:MAG TPA: DUF3105 domain-containing protein [Thermomicrobiales bacterium]
MTKRMSRYLEKSIPLVMILFCLVALIAFLRLPTPAGSAPPAAAAQAAMPGREVPTLPSPHIPYIGAKHTPYNTVPPTSGPHVPFTIAPGVYREEIPEELQVHALEHGHVLIQYAPNTPADDVKAIEDIARRFPRDVVIAPYAKLTGGLALTAWGRIDLLDHLDRDEIDAFVEDFAGRYHHGWRTSPNDHPWWAFWR